MKIKIKRREIGIKGEIKTKIHSPPFTFTLERNASFLLVLLSLLLLREKLRLVLGEPCFLSPLI